MENRIKDLRLAHGLTQQTLGSRIGTTAATIQRLETGLRKLTVDWIEQIADGLGCDPGEILRRAGEIPVVGYFELDGVVSWKPQTDPPEYAPAPPGIDSRRLAAVVPSRQKSSTYLAGYYYFERAPGAGVEKCVNRMSVVKTADSASFLRIVTASSAVGKWNLHTLVAPPIRQVEIDWAAPIEWIMPLAVDDLTD